MITVRGYELHIAYKITDPVDRVYRVTLWRQPLRYWLWAQIYHVYDMLVWRVPGFFRLEAWLLEREERKLGGGRLATPLGAKQDIRCYHLTQKGRDSVVTFDVSRDVYERLRGCRSDPR